MLKMNYPKSPFLRNPLVESQILKRNLPLAEDLLQWLCQTPKTTTYRVNLLKTTKEGFKEHLIQLLEKKYAKPPIVFEVPGFPEVICINQHANSVPDKVPDDCKEVIVDANCGAALLRGAHIFAPGVVAMQSGTQKDEIVKIFADLSKKCKKGTNTRFESNLKMFIGEGIVRMQRHQLYAPNLIPNGIAVEMVYTISGVPSLGDLGYLSNDVLLQNFPSILAVRILNPQPGELILDMCAAPGNKTTHIAEMMCDNGTIIALDKTETKIKQVHDKIKRNNLKSIKAYAFDSTQSFNQSAPEQTIKLQPPFNANTFNRILLDAPCSALGNRPLLSSDMKPNMLHSYPCVQRKLFANAVELLKHEGTLVYSTCTVTEEENELMVAWALKKFPELELVAATPVFGGPGLPNTDLSNSQRHLVQRFGPAHTNASNTIDTIGFFIAKFIKKDHKPRF